MSDTICEETIDAGKVAAHNDAFRRNACLAIPYGTGDPVLAGRMVMTDSVNAEGMGFVQSCLDAIGRLDHFPADNDPDGYHDFGSIKVLGTTAWFKIDLYDDKAMAFGSDAPDDPARTYRVLTVMLPSDW